VDAGISKESRPLSVTQPKQRALCFETPRLETPTIPVDRCRPCAGRLSTKFLKGRRNRDPHRADAWSQIEGADLHVAMLAYEHVDEPKPKCRQGTRSELLVRDFGHAKTERPLPIVIGQDETQRRGLFLNGDSWMWSRCRVRSGTRKILLASC
jgi:hypothetical protein